MNTEKVTTFLLLTTMFMVIGCEYYKDKLSIKNDSNRDICFETLILDKENKVFFQASAGGKIRALDSGRAIVREGAVSEMIDKYSLDKKLYIVFYDPADVNYVHTHIPTIISSKKVIVRIYRDTQLDSLNWKIRY